MDNAIPEPAAGNYIDAIDRLPVIDRLAELSDVFSVVSDVLSAIEDIAAEDSSVAISLARAGRKYLQTLESASADIAEFCRTAAAARANLATAKN